MEEELANMDKKMRFYTKVLEILTEVDKCSMKVRKFECPICDGDAYAYISKEGMPNAHCTRCNEAIISEH